MTEKSLAVATLEDWSLSKGNDFYNFIDMESAEVIRSRIKGNTVSVRVEVVIMTPDEITRKAIRTIKMELKEDE